MQIDKKNILVASGIALFFLIVIITVLPYPAAAKRLPLLLGIIGLILAVLIIIQSYRLTPKETQLEGKNPYPNLYKALIWMFIILPVLLLLGFHLGLGFYTFLYCRLHRGRWWESLLAGLSVVLFVHIIFVVLLKTWIPRGLLFDLLIERM